MILLSPRFRIKTVRSKTPDDYGVPIIPKHHIQRKQNFWARWKTMDVRFTEISADTILFRRASRENGVVLEHKEVLV